jgi:putative DNA methylase
MARIKGETKSERIAKAVAEAVQAGKEWHLPGVDFNDPNRPKTCLEVDFPILPINHVAAIEGKGSGALKPVYQTMKWWARRRSSVFRAMLIAAATKAPDDHAEADKLVWDAYYGNHQKNEAFQKLKVADIFMGGGTTIVEGARLGMQMYGNDLNPVAWFVVKNELAQVDSADVQKLLDRIEAEVKPQLMPFYACDCPRGHKGKWTHGPTKKVMPQTFDPLALTPEQRPEYEYEGPEVIYTFWSKHGPCQNAECGHRTPIMSSPVMAVKTPSVRVWRNKTCAGCEKTFDVEAQEARMAPAALFVRSPEELPYSIRNGDATYDCPHCGHVNQSALGNPDKKEKKIDLTLIVHPDWLKGAPGKDDQGIPFGGSVADDAKSTARWNAERAKMLKLIEVRGPLPEEIECPDTKEKFRTDSKGGTVPKKSTFTCMEATCGKQWDVLGAIQKSRNSGPVSMFAIQGYCPQCYKLNDALSGRFYATPSRSSFAAANTEWEERSRSDLVDYWPKSDVPFGFMTGMANGDIRKGHGFSRWATMFNPRQLLIHSLLLKAIHGLGCTWTLKELLLGVFQQYLRNQNMFCFWNMQRALEPMFSNNNFHPKNTSIENSLFSGHGRGDFHSSSTKLLEAIQWLSSPWEIAVDDTELHSTKIGLPDKVLACSDLTCQTASDLKQIAANSQDLVITDPPFGGLLHYSELADFFYVWLRLVLKEQYPDKFTAEYTPKALEAVANRARQPDDSDAFYQKILTECWREAARILKPSGILAFTFHHSEDEPWVAVLESLFDAGFYLEATYPIRSDETKGEGEFGSKLVEYDIIHVCRKRIDEPQEISWARLRRQILTDVKQLQDILEHHHEAGLAVADLQVIRRGKALEYYSKHYGKVYVEKGREFTVKEALAGINQLLDDQNDTTAEVPPAEAEPYTRQFMRLFADTLSLPRDQMQKFLKGTGISPAEFAERGWCSEEKKVFHLTAPLDQAQKWKGIHRKGLGRDLDQAMFLIGACYENSGINVNETLNNPNFIPHPATRDILEWFTRHGGDAPMKEGARLAKHLYAKWEASNKPKIEAVQRSLFDGLDQNT